MNNTVKLYHDGAWYRCYDDDADVVAILTNYKGFVDRNTNRYSVGFPVTVYEKVINLLKNNSINFVSDKESRDYGNWNSYKKVLDRRLTEQTISGDFTVKYEGVDDIETFTIGESISQDAELTKHVIIANVGDIIEFNNNRVFLIDKKIQIDN